MEQIAITAKHLNESHTPLQYCIFDENGGTIGSDSTNNFCLQDTEIQERHVSIQYEEGCFTIASIGDSDIFYNESFSALRAGYETTINLGDTFRIGNYKFTIIDPKDIQEDFVDNKKILNEVARYNKLDALEIKPRGQVSGLHLDEEKIEDILSKNKDIEDLAQIPTMKDLSSIFKNIQKHQSSFESTGENPYSEHQETNDSATQTHDTDTHNAPILESITTLLRDTLATAQSTPLPLDTILAKAKVMPLSSQTLQNTLNNTLLIDSIPLINSLILAIIAKELNNPMYEILDDNPLNLTLDYAITQSIQGSTKELQTLTIEALKSYLAL